MPETFRVTTRTQPVQIHFGAGEVTVGEVFLHGAVGTHLGEETVLDVVNEASPFFPVLVGAPRQRTLLVAKSQVRYVRFPRTVSSRAPALGSELALEVQCDDGALLTGTTIVDLRPGSQRTLDFMNSTLTGFFALSESEHDVLINRCHVRHVCDVIPSSPSKPNV